MKMKCFHYPKSFTLGKLNFQLHNQWFTFRKKLFSRISRQNFTRIEEPLTNFILLVLKNFRFYSIYLFLESSGQKTESLHLHLSVVTSLPFNIKTLLLIISISLAITNQKLIISIQFKKISVKCF